MKLGAGTWALLIVGGLLCLALIPALIPDSPEDAARKEAARQIEVCREGERDELAELATRRQVRAMCDRMEQQFRERYRSSP